MPCSRWPWPRATSRNVASRQTSTFRPLNEGRLLSAEADQALSSVECHFWTFEAINMVLRGQRLQWQQSTGHIPGLSQVMTQVTVFGGSGFIGRHLVEHLARAGASVRVATRHPPQTAEPSRLARIQQVEADILDDEAVQAAIRGADTVINLVGILSPAQRQTFTAIHEAGARRVAASAKHLGVKQLVHVSALGAGRTAPALAPPASSSPDMS